MSFNLISKLLFIGSVTLIISLIHYYLYRRLVVDTQASRVFRLIAKIFLISAVVVFPFSRYLDRYGLYFIVLLPIFIWFGSAILLTLYFLTVDFFRQIFRVQFHPQRRLFFNKTLAYGGLLSTSGFQLYGYHRAYSFQVKQVAVPIKNLPLPFSGFRIAQITDLHVGPFITKDFVERVVAQVNDLKPDLIAITGDLVDGSVDELRNHVAPLGNLKSSHGTFFVTGNHEFYSGADSWCEHLSSMGMTVLRNQRQSLQRDFSQIQIAGIEDWSSDRFGEGPDLEKACLGADPALPLILLSHQPRSFKEAQQRGISLQISGHTHGGQIWPIGHLIPIIYSPYVRGLYKVNESHIYVSCGTGFWGPPLRLDAPSEVTLIELGPA